MILTGILDRIATLAQGEEPFVVATVVRTADATSAKAGAKAIVRADGSLEGYLGGGCVAGAVKRAAKRVLLDGRPGMISIRPTDTLDTATAEAGIELHGSSCPSGGTVDLFIEPMVRATRLVVLGTTPVAAAVADLGSRLGYRVAVHGAADDLSMVPDELPAVAGFDLSAHRLGPLDCVIVASQGKRDRAALQAALASDAGYVGMVASHRKAEKLTAELTGGGAAVRPRLRAPAGLNIGAMEPGEIAVSILAEIVAWRRGQAAPDVGRSSAAATVGSTAHR